MPLSNSILSYEDVRAHFDRALSSEKGLILRFKSPGQAIHFRQRGYKFRVLDRIRNTELYPDGDPMHGCSPYDILRIDIVKGESVAHIRKMTAEDTSIEVSEIE